MESWYVPVCSSIAAFVFLISKIKLVEISAYSLLQCGRLYHAEQQIRTALQKVSDTSAGFSKKTSEAARLLGRAISAAKRKADEENNTVYMSRVPVPHELENVVPAVMAKVVPFDLRPSLQM